MTTIIAYLIPIVLFILGIRYEKSKLITFLFMLYFWVLMGLNTFTPDYENYSRHFYYPELDFEIGFQYLCYILNKAGFTYQQFRMFYAAIYSILAVVATKRLTSHTNYVLAMFLLWPFVPFVSGLRIAMATMIVCFSIPFLLQEHKGGITKFVICILLACSIHISSLFYLVFIFARKRYKIKNYLLIFFAATAVSVLMRLNILASLVMRLNNDKFIKWFSLIDSTEVNHLNLIGFLSSTFFIIAFALLIGRLAKLMHKSMAHNYEAVGTVESETLDIQRITLYSNIAFMMILTIPGYIVSAEYQRFLFGILPVYYAVFGDFRKRRIHIPSSNKWVYSTLSLLLVIMLAALYIYSMQSHDVFATLVDNILFQ